MKKNFSRSLLLALLCVGLFLLSCYLFPDLCDELYARAGGGGGRGRGGRGGGGRGESIVTIILYILISIPCFIWAGYIRFRIYTKSKSVSKALANMVIHEPNWSEPKLRMLATDMFYKLQAAWCEQDLATLKKHLHPYLYPIWESQVQGFMKKKKRNVLEGLVLKNLRFVDVKNYLDDERDEFTVCVDAWAKDHVRHRNQTIKTRAEDFREFWTFEWEKGEWLLREISQAASWSRFVPARIVYERLNYFRKSS